MPHIISKTQFISGCHCEKLLWLMQHRPEVCADTNDKRTADGEEVGALARTYFEGAVTVPLAKASVMARETARLIEAGHRTICEATFIANHLSCSADIVRISPDGLDLIEVKSSTHPKDVQISDISFQCFVIEQAGYHIRSVQLMHINGDYILEGELDVHSLFVLKDVSHEVAYRSDEVKRRIKELAVVSESEAEPGKCLSLACDKPYPCACKEYCFKLHEVPEISVFDIPGMTAKKKYELYSAGYTTPESLKRAPALVTHLTARQMARVEAMDIDDSKYTEIDIAEVPLRAFLESLSYPLYLLDFESFQHPIPKFQGAKPYMQIPFQYSLHVMPAVDETPLHTEFLAAVGEDPRRNLAEQMCRDIPAGAQCVAYNAAFEKSVCRHLAELYPDLRDHLLGIADKMIDLMIPFRNQWVVSSAMHGSYSIKAVLPALCPAEQYPELDYHALPVVHNGGEAMAAFAELSKDTEAAVVEKVRNGLLAYCGLDTLAMVRIIQRLYALVNGGGDCV